MQPTREQLLKLRRRKVLAQAVLDVLQRDLSALTEEFFRYLDMITPLRSKAYKALDAAHGFYAEAKMLMGHKLSALSWVSATERFQVEVKTQSFRKFTLPLLELVKVTGEEGGQGVTPGYSITASTARIDDAVAYVEEALKALVKLAEVEGAITTIVEAMAAIKRKMNFIQHKVMPQLDATIRWVELILEETEREDSIRIRVLQNKRKQARIT